MHDNSRAAKSRLSIGSDRRVSAVSSDAALISSIIDPRDDREAVCTSLKQEQARQITAIPNLNSFQKSLPIDGPLLDSSVLLFDDSRLGSSQLVNLV